MQEANSSNKHDCIQLKLYHLKHKSENIYSVLRTNNSNEHNKLASSFIFGFEHLTQFLPVLKSLCMWEWVWNIALCYHSNFIGERSLRDKMQFDHWNNLQEKMGACISFEFLNSQFP